MKPSNSIILNKSKEFALNIIELYKYLCKEKKEFIILNKFFVVAPV